MTPASRERYLVQAAWGLRFAWLLTLGILSPAAAEALPTATGARPVYAAYVLSNPISVIDTGTNTVATPIPVFSEGGRGIAASPDGAFVYVVHYAGSVSVIATATNMVAASVPIVGSGIGIAITPDGSEASVANFLTPGKVSVIDTATNTVATTIDVSAGPYGVAITPAGTHAYVTHQVYHPGLVSVIDTATNTVATTITVGNTPEGVAITPDSRYAYVTNNNSNTVSVIDTTTNTIATT